MNLNPKNLIKILEQHGFVFKRSKGSHQLYYKPYYQQNRYCACTWG